MKIAISMEMTRKLRDTWHIALNHEWYDFLHDEEIIPLSCHGKLPQTDEFDLVILAGGNDMHDIKTWRDNNYPIRDMYERNLIKQCLITHTPIMGICRGAHFMNYTMGGTHKLMNSPYDDVKVKLPNFEVTCHHTIQIDKVAPEFEILQEDSNGVVELVISTKHRMLGVGWHPERIVNTHTREYIYSLIRKL